ncbi:MAG: amidase [Nitriliruptoraceae bacterium]
MTLVGRSAVELADLVASGEVSARTVVEAHLARIRVVDRRLGAFVATRAQAALQEADAVDEHPDRSALPLAGVPVAVKDVLDVAGLATRHGSLATSATPAVADDPLVARLKQAGAIVVGKTRCPELSLWGTSDDPTATVVSPWDPTRSAGGSSGGSAAAVAAGLVPVALGTDGLGSVRIPAAACGTVGLRPGAPHLGCEVDGTPHWFGMTRFGPFATTVGDAARLADVLSGGTRFEQVTEPPAPLDIAVSWRPPAPGVTVSGAWREAALEAGRLLHHAGHDVTRADPPYDRSLVPAVVARWTQGAAADAAHLGLEPDDLQPRTRAHIAAGERLTRVAEVEDEDVLAWRERLAPFFADHDVLITPTFARAQPASTAWHTRPWAANIAANLSAYPFTAAWNLADLPTIVVPLWEDGGRPLSVQVVANAGREDLVLGLARLLERLVPWRRHAPGWGVPARAG